MHRLHTSYTIRTFNSLHVGVFGTFKRTVDFFCEGPSDLRILCAYDGEWVKQGFKDE